MWNIFCVQFNLAARLWITACPWRAIANGETTKPSDFNTTPGRKGISHMVNDGLNRSLNIACCKLRVFKTQDLYQV